MIFVPVQHPLDLMAFNLLRNILCVTKSVRQPYTSILFHTSCDEGSPSEADNLEIKLTYIHSENAFVQLQGRNIEHKDFILGAFDATISEKEHWWLSVKTDLAATHGLVVEEVAALL